jgi:hypothetical protein
MTIGKFMWAPFQGMISDDDEVGDRIKNTTNDERVIDIQGKIIYQILLMTSIIWLLVLMFPIIVATIVVVEREKPLNTVPKRVYKKERFLNERATFLLLRSIN